MYSTTAIRAWCVSVLMLFAALGQAATATAAPQYAVTVIGGAGGAATGLNSSGQVVGNVLADGRYQAFFHDGSTIVNIGLPGGAGSQAHGVNDSGTVVGWADAADGTRQSFVHANGLTFTLAVGGPSEANAINNAGAITGTLSITDGSGSAIRRAYIWAAGEVTLPGLALAETYGYGEINFGNGINNAGMVAGAAAINASPDFPSQPFLYSHGVMQDLGDFGGSNSAAWGINDLGEVVGAAGVETSATQPNVYGYHAFLYSGGVLQDLGTLDDRYDSMASDINNLGQVVGNAATRDGFRAALFADGAVTLLDTLIDPAAGWTITNASAINDAGQIAGSACRLGLCYAVRLDLAPIPEPAHAFMLAAGLLVLLRQRGVHVPTSCGAVTAIHQRRSCI